MPIWSYVWREFSHRILRVALISSGIALGMTLVVMLDVLGDGFSGLATVPFKSLGSDLIVQRGPKDSNITQQRGLILPYSAQAIQRNELEAIKNLPDVSKLSEFVLLWNFGSGRFFSISGVPFNEDSSLIGPAKVRTWVVEGRAPQPGTKEVLVELHYGTFYRIKPGSQIDLGGENFTVAGLVDIKEGSQLVASNVYMDIDAARRLGSLAPGEANQLFVTVKSAAETESVKSEIARILPQASMTSANSLLKLFGGISQMAASLKSFTLFVAFSIAIAVIGVLVYGVLAERQRDAAILRAFGWSVTQVRVQFMFEMALLGLLGGLLGALVSMAGAEALGQLSFDLPTNLGNENPTGFAKEAWKAKASSIPLPVALSLWKLILLPIAGSLICFTMGWAFTSKLSKESPWARIKAG